MTQTNELSRRNTQGGPLAQALTQLEHVVDQCSLATLAGQGRFERAFTLAAGVRQLREMITPDMMQQIMPLQGTSLGFRTDQDNRNGYDSHVVKECLIEAVLRGVMPVGNQFNIIANRCYITREGFTQLLKEFPGLTDLKIIPSVPKMGEKGALVTCRATWRLEGKTDSLEREIPVRINANMGIDAVLGKADRKMKASIYAYLTGTEHSDGDVEDLPAKPVSSVVTNTPRVLDELHNAAHQGGNGGGAPGTVSDPFGYAVATPEKPRDDDEAERILQEAAAKARMTDAARKCPPVTPAAPAGGEPAAAGEEETWIGSNLPTRLPDHARTSDEWINEVITRFRPAEIPARTARVKFHALHAGTLWSMVKPEEQDRLYEDLMTGAIAWK